MNEFWREIDGFSNYRISSFGKIKNVKTNKILSLQKASNNYVKVHLWKDNCDNYMFLHRLLAETFIPNPNNYKVVNHIDGNKYNNSLCNLEWCTHSENLKHAYNTNLRSITENCKEKMRENGKKRRKSVVQYDLQGKKIGVYESLSLASKITNIPASTISRHCRNKVEKANKYTWRFEHEE